MAHGLLATLLVLLSFPFFVLAALALTHRRRALNAPVLTAAQSSLTTIDVSWTTPPGATSYILEIDGVDQPPTMTNAFTHTVTAPSHTYRVRASDAGDTLSPYSNAVTVTMQPIYLSMTRNTQTAWTATWTTAATVDSFTVQSKNKANPMAPWITRATEPFTIPGLYATVIALSPNDATFDIRVISGTPALTSNLVDVDTLASVIPGPVDPLVVVQGTPADTTVDLDWQASMNDNASSYQVERAVHPLGPYTLLITTTTATTYLDTTVTANTQYYYRVRGVNVVGPGPWATNDIVTGPPSPAAPIILTGEQTGPLMITITVQDQSLNETLFDLEGRDAALMGPFVHIDDLPAEPGSGGTFTYGHLDTAGLYVSTWQYRVRAFRAGFGYSAYSNVITVVMDPYPGPASGTIDPGSVPNSLKVTWNIPNSTSCLLNAFSLTTTSQIIGNLIVSAPDGTYEITGLTPGHSYLISIEGSNLSGSEAVSLFDTV